MILNKFLPVSAKLQYEYILFFLFLYIGSDLLCHDTETIKRKLLKGERSGEIRVHSHYLLTSLQKQLKREQEQVRTDDKGLLSTGDGRGEAICGRVGVRGSLGGGRRGRGGRGETKRVQSEPAKVGHTRRVHHIPHRVSVVSLSLSDE
jgi:hypothetical protein